MLPTAWELPVLDGVCVAVRLPPAANETLPHLEELHPQLSQRSVERDEEVLAKRQSRHQARRDSTRIIGLRPAGPRREPTLFRRWLLNDPAVLRLGQPITPAMRRPPLNTL